MSIRREFRAGSASHAPPAQIGMEFHPFALIGALAAASVAFAVLAGWLTGVDGLSTFLSNTTPMRINTALEHLGNVDFRIDPLFGNDMAHYASHPGRMSIEAAFLLVALGTATALRTLGSCGRLAGVLVTLTALSSLFALLRYFYGAADLYAERGPTRLSVPASFALNAAAERVSGWAQREVESAPFWETFLAESERDAVVEVFGRIRAGDFPMAFENHWRTRSGELRRVAWSNHAITRAGGEVASSSRAGSTSRTSAARSENARSAT